jgi:ribulose-phosphate 3-epimerase
MTTRPLKISASLWSADLANLESEIRRVDPYVDSYHIDVADGTSAPIMLFFPDLLAAIRGKTQKPFQAHLITQRPRMWVEAFARAGADWIIFYADTTDATQEVIDTIKAHDLRAGIALAVDQPVTLLQPYWDQVGLVCVLGTDLGVKGVQDVAAGTCDKIRALARQREERGLDFEIEADGAIRRHTVGPLRQAGADAIVPGSLIFRSSPQQLAEMCS